MRCVLRKVHPATRSAVVERYLPFGVHVTCLPQSNIVHLSPFVFAAETNQSSSPSPSPSASASPSPTTSASPGVPPPICPIRSTIRFHCPQHLIQPDTSSFHLGRSLCLPATRPCPLSTPNSFTPSPSLLEMMVGPLEAHARCRCLDGDPLARYGKLRKSAGGLFNMVGGSSALKRSSTFHRGQDDFGQNRLLKRRRVMKLPQLPKRVGHPHC